MAVRRHGVSMMVVMTVMVAGLHLFSTLSGDGGCCQPWDVKNVGFVAAHPNHKNKNVVRVGHPIVCGWNGVRKMNKENQVAWGWSLEGGRICSWRRLMT